MIIGNWVGNTGRVYVKYLKPIMPSEVSSRDEMNQLVSVITSALMVLIFSLFHHIGKTAYVTWNEKLPERYLCSIIFF